MPAPSTSMLARNLAICAVALIACSKQPETSAPTTGSDPSASSTPHRRKRTGPPKMLAGAASLPDGSKTFNPKHGSSFIVVAADDTCHYKTIEGAPSNAPSGPWRTVVVDCPPLFDDPAFDSCIGGKIAGIAGAARCVCTSESGDSSAVACPK